MDLSELKSIERDLDRINTELNWVDRMDGSEVMDAKETVNRIIADAYSISGALNMMHKI